jgi:16S rRNA (cytidine1402-2'-O)-methyltransferase
MGTLYVVATPIGNLEDLSPRAARVLNEAPIIAAEGVNRTKKLLSHLGLAGKKMISCRESNRRRAAVQVLEHLAGGRDVALVSDAGTPGLSDPGGVVVDEAARAGFRVCPIPGPSALAAGLSVSGMPGAPVVFLGFLPAKSGERKRLAQKAAQTGWPMVIYEAPHRLAGTAADLLEALGDRQAVLCRELSKVHEQVSHTRLGQLAAWSEDREIKGEITLILAAGAPPVPEDAPGPWELADRLLKQGLEQGDIKPSKLAKQTAAKAGLPRDEVYQRLLVLKTNMGQTRKNESS